MPPSDPPRTPFLILYLAYWEGKLHVCKRVGGPHCVWPKKKGSGQELGGTFWEWLAAFSPKFFLGLFVCFLLACMDKQLVGSIFPERPLVTIHRAIPGTSQSVPSSSLYLNSLHYFCTNALPHSCVYTFSEHMQMLPLGLGLCGAFGHFSFRFLMKILWKNWAGNLSLRKRFWPIFMDGCVSLPHLSPF